MVLIFLKRTRNETHKRSGNTKTRVFFYSDSKICTAPTDGGRSATDGGWRQSATGPRPEF